MTKMTKAGNLSESFLRTERKRMPLVGMEDAYEITRTGLIWSLDDEDWVEPTATWPFVKLIYQDRLLDLNLVELLALSWLTAAQRVALRTALGPQQKPWSTELLAQEQALQVPAYALAAACNSTCDYDFAHWDRIVDGENVTQSQVKNATVEKYASYLFEHYRPPSKGGNTRAVHTHVLQIDGLSYSFFALGTKQWVFAGDTVSFSFVLTAKGFRNILRDTLVTKDKNGNIVVRGLRGKKRVLRTEPTRLPVSRREQR